MTTYYTKNDLAVRMLRVIGAVASDETPSAADLQWAIDIIDTQGITIQQDGINIWDGTEEIVPDSYLTPLAERLSIHMAQSFGLESQTTISQAQTAERTLRRLSATQATFEPQQAEYF